MSEVAQILVGRTLAGTYLLERWLGQGGHGTIYQGRHLRTGGLLAIKLLRRDVVTDPQLMSRFTAEARIIAELRHPHIVQVRDCDQDDDEGPFMVMELLEGETLQERLTRVGRLDYLATCELASQVGSALHAVHEQGIIHRDIKPANIFITRRRLIGESEDFFKIVDFGISKLRLGGTQTATHQLLGTPQYMAPEAAMQKSGEIDGRADQFSLAVALYRVLSGRVPFDGDDPIGVLHRVVYEEPEPLAQLVPELPAHALAAIARGMAKHRDDRYSTIDEFVRALHGLSAAETVTVVNEAQRPQVLSGSFTSVRSLADGTTLDPNTSDQISPLAVPDKLSLPLTEPEHPGPSQRTPYSLANGAQQNPGTGQPTFRYVSWAGIAGLGILIGLLASIGLRRAPVQTRSEAEPASARSGKSLFQRDMTATASVQAKPPPVPVDMADDAYLITATLQSPAIQGRDMSSEFAAAAKKLIRLVRPSHGYGLGSAPGPERAESSGAERLSSECCVVKAANVSGLRSSMQPAMKSYLDSHRIVLCGNRPVVIIQSPYDRDLKIQGKLPDRTPQKPFDSFLIHLHGSLPIAYVLPAPIIIRCP